MGTEIERRFLVKEGFDPASLAYDKSIIEQSYLANTGDWTVRVRKEDWGEVGVFYSLTLKKFVGGAENVEIETNITESEYQDALTQTKTKLTKTRYRIKGADGKGWEVDVYIDAPPEFQTICEVELTVENEDLLIPDWVEREVTGDRSFSNSALAERLTTN